MRRSELPKMFFRLAVSALLLSAAFAAAAPGKSGPKPFDRDAYLLKALSGLRTSGDTLIGASKTWKLLPAAVKEVLHPSAADKLVQRAASKSPEAKKALKTLKRMARAFSLRQRHKLISLFHDDFRGNLRVLEDALAADFRAAVYAKMSLVEEQVEVSGDKVSISARYDISLTAPAGTVQKFKGRVKILMGKDGRKFKVLSMKPMLFGYSFPFSKFPVGRGTGTATERGLTTPGPSGSVPPAIYGTGRVEVLTTNYDFSRKRGLAFAQSGADLSVAASTDLEMIGTGKIVNIGSCNLSFLSSVPETITGTTAATTVGDCYALFTPDSYYVAIKVRSITAPGPTPIITFRFKLQRKRNVPFF